MARVVITIEDRDDGTVHAVASPNVAELVNLARRDAGLSPAQAYALRALRAVVDASHEAHRGRSPLILPPGVHRR